MILMHWALIALSILDTTDKIDRSRTIYFNRSLLYVEQLIRIHVFTGRLFKYVEKKTQIPVNQTTTGESSISYPVYVHLLDETMKKHVFFYHERIRLNKALL